MKHESPECSGPCDHLGVAPYRVLLRALQSPIPWNIPFRGSCKNPQIEVPALGGIIHGVVEHWLGETLHRVMHRAVHVLPEGVDGRPQAPQLLGQGGRDGRLCTAMHHLCTSVYGMHCTD